MKNQELYDARVEDIISTCNHKEPKVVPVMANVLTWAIGYAKGSTNDVLDNPQKLPEIWSKFLEDVYCDVNYVAGLTTPVRALERLGSHAFFVSKDNHTIQHSEHCVMEEDEYNELISNPLPFLMNVLGKRKFPELQKSKEEAYKALADVALNIDKFGAANMQCSEIAKNKYGVVSMLGGHKVYPTVDVIFDRLRGMKGTLVDIRRRKDNVIKASYSLHPIYQKLTSNVPTAFPYSPCTLHCPTYLRPKDFKEIFWPEFHELLMEIYNRGSKTLMFMEGKWENYYQLMLDELPQSSVLCLLEGDDIIKAKKMIGNKFTIMGGVNSNLMRYGTIQECKDEAKRIIDECAPGGGFIFTTEKSLCTLGDVKVENLIAVNQFVHEYGKY